MSNYAPLLHPIQSSVTFSFVPREVVARGRSLEVCGASAFHSECCHNIIFCQGFKQVKPTVAPSDDLRTLIISTAGLEPGPWDLSTGKLLDQQSSVVLQSMAIPLLIIDMKATIPAGCRVEHVLRVAVGKTICRRLKPDETASDDETYLEMVKVVDCKTNKMAIKTFNFTQEGSQSDGDYFLRELRRGLNGKYGSISESLQRRLEQISDADPIDAVVVPRVGDLDGQLSSAGVAEGQADRPSQLLKTLGEYSTKIIKLLQSQGIQIIDDQPPLHFVHVTATKVQLRKLSANVEIQHILLHDTSAVPDLGVSMTISKAFVAQRLEHTGRKVNVAVYEGGPRDFTGLPLMGWFEESGPVGSTRQEIRNNNHARLTNAIISNNESADKPRGYAPDCNHFAANSGSHRALTWAVKDNHCTVVSQSFHRDTEQTDPSLSADDISTDIMARLSPFPTFVQAAGNFGDFDTPPSTSAEYVNHKGYNSISVGSHNDEARAMSPSSDFRNPGTVGMDRELPLMTANGTAVTALGLTNSGTSFAAPAVAGAVALIQGTDSRLQSMPAACRAIMLASADRKTSANKWYEDVAIGIDRLEGSGALNCEDAVKIAAVRNTGIPVPFAWDGGILPRSWLDPSTNMIFGRNWDIEVPKESSGVSTFTVKVALTWDALVRHDFVPNVPSPSVLYRNFDLLVFNEVGHQVDNSSSFHNNYEIVEFGGAPSGRKYRIVLRLASSVDPTDTRPELATYGLAWKVIPTP